MVVTPLFQSVAAPETTTMKKIKNQTTTTKVAIFAGAAALMALTPQTHAQSSVDALLNKLEQKGILSVDEAKELKAENATNSVNDFNSAMAAKFPTPDWVTSYKLSGDFRGRFDDVSTTTPFPYASGKTPDNNNMRLRYRLRVGLTVNMKDDLQVGFRLGTDDAGKGADASTGNPLSNNSTLQGNGSKKPVWIDAAYGRWIPINDGTWMVAATIGKMDQPFQASSMVFDPDYTPEGAALQATYKVNNNNSLAVNGGAFVLDQVNTRGPFLYGAQAIWNSTWTPKLGTSLGVASYDIANNQNIAISSTGPNPYDSNLGNTIVGGAAGAFARNFNPVVASGSVTYTLDSSPLYPGAFPVKLGGEYLDNPSAGGNNKGWNAGVTLGKSGKKGTWDLSYRYQRLEADAWWDQVVDDDNVALFPVATGTFGNTAVAAAGGTDIKGHLIKFNYSIYDSLTFTFTAYINDLINNPVPGTKTDAVHAMADLMWKF
jgi:hypothetical protein